MNPPEPSGNQETFFKLIENAPFGVYLVDADFRLRQVSAGAQKVFQNVRPLLGRDFAEVLRIIWTEPFASEAISRFRHTLETGEPYSNDTTTEYRSDIPAVETYDWKIERITLPDGQYGVVCYFYDITERQAAQSMAEFLGRLSQKLHEAKTPNELIRLTTEAVGEHLRLHRCYFFEVVGNSSEVNVLADWRQSGSELAGNYKLSNFGTAEWLTSIRQTTTAFDDISSHPWTQNFMAGYESLQFRSYAISPFIQEGKWVASMGMSMDQPHAWTRYELAVLENVVARVWPLVERARVAEELSLSEERYRSLFDSIDEGFCIIDMVYDTEGRAVDYRFVQANPAFEQLTGLQAAIGKTAVEMVPTLEPFWIDTYARVAESGEAIRFEREASSLNRWFDVHASRVGGSHSRRVAVIFNNITERKSSEQALALLTEESDKTRRLYETVLATTPDLAYVFDLNHRFTYANGALLKMWGMTWEQAKFKNCLEIGYPDWHAAMHSREIEQVVATKQPVRGEVPFEGTNGRRIYDYILVPVIGADDQVEAVAGTTRDVTDSRAAAEKITLQKTQFETLLSQAPLGVYVVDDEFRLSHLNAGAVKAFGDIPDLVGRDFSDILHILWEPTTADEIVNIFRHTLATGEPYETGEIAEQRNDRKKMEYYQWRIDRLTLPNGKYGVVCYFMDISNQVNARHVIQESEERFRTLVSVIADVSWVADAAGNFSTPQLAWETFTGQSWETSQGLGWMNAFHPEDRASIQATWLAACNSGRLFECNGRMWHAASQTWRYFTARATPVFNPDHSVREWVGSCTDVDVQKHTEAALRLARDQAEEVSRAKDRFLAVLSHELRTPLTPVLMTVAAMEHDPQLSPEVREDLAMVKRNIELETKLIDDLLDLSRITSGKLVLKSETVDLHEVLQRVFAICLPQAREQKVNLELQATGDILLVDADAARLQQIFWNVVRNAIKFTPAGGYILVTTARLEDGRCEVRVQDSGVGIPAEALPHVFDAFEQGGANVTRQFGGLGLGLAICSTLVSMHGGSIRAESKGEGKGTTFIIDLPCSIHTTRSAVSGFPESSSSGGRQTRLLLVDDHSDTLRTLSRMLRRKGFQVLTADSVASAKLVATNQVFDLLVSDLGLPDGNGYEIMRHVQEHRGVTGIAMSGYGMEEDISRSREAGFREHLVKPVDFNHLLAAIERVTKDSRL